MVISCKRAFVGRCTQSITRMRQPSRRGTWEELKSNCVAQSGSCVSRSAFDFVAVVAHKSDSQSVNRLPKSIVILLFAVVIWVLFIAVAML